jgi:predicted ester cyclase
MVEMLFSKDINMSIRVCARLKQVFSLGFNAFPDWHETIEDIIAEGDKVWVRLTYSRARD